MSRLLGAAIVGAAGVGTVHARALAGIEGVELRAVIGSTNDSSQRHAMRLGVNNACTTFEELCASDRIDVVHICTPNRSHLRLAAAALRAGKHVICEKPLTEHVTTADDLIDVCAEVADVGLYLCQPYRFMPCVGELSEVVASRLGTVYGVRASYLQNWMLTEPPGWRSDPLEAGDSRVLLDLGTHLIDLVEFVSGHIATNAVAVFSARDTGVDMGSDDHVAMLVSLDGGAVASLAMSQISAAHQNQVLLEVDGSNGSARWSLDSSERLEVVMTQDCEPLALDGTAGMSRHGTFRESVNAGDGHVVAMLTAMYRDIATGGAERDRRLVGVETGRRHLQLIHDARHVANRTCARTTISTEPTNIQP